MEPVHGDCLVGHAYGGALHVWSLKDHGSGDGTETNSELMTAEERASLVSWTATPCITGHFAGVTDLCWEASSGQYLLTVSNDQTCRLWAPLMNRGGSDTNERAIWLELGRPQVHGYDLSAITSISTPQHPHRFLSGADEKEIRVFDAPSATLRLLNAVSSKDDFEKDSTDRVERAFIPSLGLTNKATAAEGAEEDVDEDAPVIQSVETILPMERDLGSESIWPEVRKLFGHNTEIYCLASTCAARTAGDLYIPGTHNFMDDTLVASSAKARDEEAACIRIWDVSSSQCVQVLTNGHKSTVATMSFSPDGQYLVSSGKDRRLCLWKRDLSSGLFVLAWAKDSAHKRIIWSVRACPFDETLFASGSRDGCIRLWMIKTDGSSTDVACLGSFAPHHQVDGKPDAVTALAFAPSPIGDKTTMVLAVGLESGRMELWKLSVDKEAMNASVELYHEFAEACCHSARVSKLAWKPLASSVTTSRNLTLASCAMDHGCRLFSVDLVR